MVVESLITQHLDIWTSAIKTKSAAGRGISKKLELVGVKKLRELILELAVRGKLVPQDPYDEPASELLKKIEVEKAQLLKEGKIKKQKPSSPIGDEEQPFELPVGWEFVRLSEIGHDWGQKTPDSEFTYIDVGAINKELGFVSEPNILTASDAPSRARKIVKKGTVIYSTVRPYLLNIAVINEVFDPVPIASTAFAIVHPFKGVLASFIYRYLRSPTFINYVEGHQMGIAYPAINDKQFFSGILPLPPKEEQHRIVAKVDELMALCDQLETQTEASIEAHKTLVEVLLATLTNAKDADELNDNWQTISQHFDVLFTTQASIDQLKQTILQLAVMGKLVKQDPNDEPASKLLERIATEKQQLIKDGKIKKQKPLPPISDEEKPFELPDGWEWSRLPDIGELARGKSKHRPRNDPSLYVGGNIKLVQTGDVANANRNSDVINTFTALYNSKGLNQSRLWPKGTMCITIAANIADTGILGFDACFPDSVVGFTPFEQSINVKYFEYFIRTAKSNLEAYAPSTAQKNINLEILGQLLVPLPPLNELNCIVLKVVSLMDLCDSLKERLNQAQTVQLHLTDAIVEQAL
jgi:type I restriction enzyme S subunit